MSKCGHGWIVVNRTLKDVPKFAAHIEKYRESFDALGVKLLVKCNDELSYEITSHSLVYDLPKPDFVLFWDKDVRLAAALERDFPVFNGARTIEICDNKQLTHAALARNKIAAPRTIFAPKYFRREDLPPESYIDTVIKQLGLPLVVKEAFGSFGSGVSLCKNRAEIYDTIGKIGGDRPYLFQEFVASSAGRDLRVYVADGCVVGGVIRENGSDFRAGASSGGKMTVKKLTEAEEESALAAAAATGADFAGVDILFGAEGAPLVCEVNSNAHFINFLNASGIDFSRITAQKIKEYLIK